MTWETILKARKKINMPHLRKIVDHILPNMEDEFALADLIKMVTSTYLKYNPDTKRSLNIASTLGAMLKNRGYEIFHKYSQGERSTYYRKVQ
mgnify:CR=1 FL=1|tara:strand:+ start:2496 stop:2771 length:276 start_codon:yes stop_codon:yes gene_type:complete